MNNRFVVIVKGVVLHNGRILIVQRAMDEKVAGGSWECPGGKVESREDLEGALKREITEETDLSVQVKNILYASLYNSDPKKQFVILTYLCESNHDVVTLSKEHMNYKWVTKDELRILLAPNIISDFERNNVFSLGDWS